MTKIEFRPTTRTVGEGDPVDQVGLRWEEPHGYVPTHWPTRVTSVPMASTMVSLWASESTDPGHRVNLATFEGTTHPSLVTHDTGDATLTPLTGGRADDPGTPPFTLVFNEDVYLVWPDRVVATYDPVAGDFVPFVSNLATVTNGTIERVVSWQNRMVVSHGNTVRWSDVNDASEWRTEIDVAATATVGAHVRRTNAGWRTMGTMDRVTDTVVNGPLLYLFGSDRVFVGETTSVEQAFRFTEVVNGVYPVPGGATAHNGTVVYVAPDGVHRLTGEGGSVLSRDVPVDRFRAGWPRPFGTDEGLFLSLDGRLWGLEPHGGTWTPYRRPVTRTDDGEVVGEEPINNVRLFGTLRRGSTVTVSGLGALTIGDLTSGQRLGDYAPDATGVPVIVDGDGSVYTLEHVGVHELEVLLEPNTVGLTTVRWVDTGEFLGASPSLTTGGSMTTEVVCTDGRSGETAAATNGPNVFEWCGVRPRLRIRLTGWAGETALRDVDVVTARSPL